MPGFHAVLSPRVVGALTALCCLAILGNPAIGAQASTGARAAYERALARERTLTNQAAPPAPRLVRRLISEYESIARQYGTTGFADNALWNGAQLSASLFARTRVESDRRTAVRLLQNLIDTYPTSSLLAQARPRLREISRRTRVADPRPAARTTSATAPARKPASTEDLALTPEPTVATRDLPAPAPPAKTTAGVQGRPAAKVVGIRRTVLPDVVRVTIELDGEVGYREERVENPARVYFDLKGVGASPRYREGVLTFRDDIVRHVRYGSRGPAITRVAMDLDGVERYSVFPLYNPFRLVIDFERTPSRGAEPKLAAAPVSPLPASPVANVIMRPPTASATRLDPAVKGTDAPPASDRGTKPSDRPTGTSGEGKGAPIPSDSLGSTVTAPLTAPNVGAPTAPAANATGSFSMARQLGLGVSRIVIDPGHGGHDPGAQGTKLWEAELVLDVAIRLEKLLLQQPGVEVVLTRRSDTFIALEERTAIANRERADLFLSIHANASRNRKARGVETYFLNFASNPEAEAVAARENSASSRTMHNLPDMVRAIALNTKLDESRDFAGMVQKAMIKRLQAVDPDTRDLGVKQAPFVVLIGAQMPSVLAEISFLTHPEEGALLRTRSYRQSIAEALFDAVVKYQRALKSVGTVAEQ